MKYGKIFDYRNRNEAEIGLRYAVASAGYSYHFDSDKSRYVIDPYPAREEKENGFEGSKKA